MDRPLADAVSAWRRPWSWLTQLFRFALIEAQSCLFPMTVFSGLAVTQLVDLPIARYDALFLYCVGVTVAFWLLGIESFREMIVIFGFHALGLGLELFKVHMGSWSYPGDALLKVGGVPLFSGFMYASVGSYICQAWRRFDLRVSRYRAVATSVVAFAIYANFFTHHWIPDLRLPIAITLLVVLWGSEVHFTVGRERYRMPVALSLVLIGFFLWLAENAATFLGAWSYPHQRDVWEVVHASKFGAWSLLVSMSFVLVATMKSIDGHLHHAVPPTTRRRRGATRS